MAEIKKISTELQLLDKFLDTSGDAGTSGQVLTSTGTGINWVSGGSLPGGPYLPLSAGSSYPLTGDLYIAKAANQGQLFFGTANANYEIFGGGFWGYMGYNTNGYHRFLIQGSEKMRINSSGNIGIGTTNPGSKLEVKTSGTNTTVELDNSDTDYTVIQYNAQGATKGFSGFNAGFMLFGGEAGVTTRLQAGGSYAATILTNGNVGIGTTSPDSLLELENSPAAQTKSRLLHIDNNPINNQGSGYIEISSGSNNQAKTQIEQVSSGGFGLLGNQYIDTNIINRGLSSSAYGNINFATGSSSSSTSIVMTIGGGSQKGNVGIGTTSPGAILHVKGSTDSTEVIIDTNDNAIGDSAFIKFNGARAQVGWIDAAVTLTDGGGNKDIKLKVNTGSIFLQTNNTSRLTVADGGNVGIGTTSPSKKLVVKSPGADNGIFLLRNSTSGIIANIIETGSGDGALLLATNAAATSVLLRGSGNNYINSGNVGIGTTSPNSKLDIRRSGNGVALELHQTSGSANDFVDLKMIAGNTGAGTLGTILRHKRDGSGGGDFSILTNPTLTGTPTEKLIVKSSGKVGIGTTSPVETLSVPGGSGVMLGFKRFYSDTGTVPAGIGSSYTLTANLNDEQGTTLTSQYQYKFYLTTTGTGTYNSSVYIVYRNSADNAWNSHRVSSTGLTSNHPELIVSGNNALIYNDHPSSYNVSYRVETSYTGQAKTSPEIFGSDYMWTRDNTDLYYMDGDVGIGVSNPAFKLDVAGTIQTTGSLKITMANPSIIFKETDITDKNWDIQVNNGNLKFYEVNDARSVFNEHLTLATGGNLGVGFTSPQAAPISSMKLSVNGNTYVAGNVGIGTTAPQALLDVSKTNSTIYDPTNDLGQRSGTATIHITNTDTTVGSFGQIMYDSDNANQGIARIVFIDSGTASVDTAFVNEHVDTKAETMRITSAGNVGIGINNPSALLEVRKGSISGQIAKFSAINPHVVIESSTAGNAVLHLKPNTTGSKSGQFKVTAGNGYNFRWSNDASGTAETAYMDLDTSTTGGGDLTVKGDVIAYGSPSDRKYKENIKPIESALDKAMQLQGVTFDWKDSESILEIKEDIGFIAQDVQEVLPELVRDNGKGNLSLRYQGITPILLEAIKELKAEIEELKLNNCNCNK